MATKNPVFLSAENPTGEAAQKRSMVYLLAKTAASHLAGAWRGFGGPTAVNGADTTDALMHVATTSTYDDEWAVHPYDVDDSPAVELTATIPTHSKGIEVYNDGPDTIYVAENNTVTSSGATQGRPVPSGAAWFLPLGPNLEAWAICGTGDTARVFATPFA